MTEGFMAAKTIIKAGEKDSRYWIDLWQHRELFQVLAWRDLSARYKQTAIGVVWTVARPLLSMIALTIVFGRIANLPSDGTAPYSLMVFAGMLPWTLFSTGLTEASSSLINNTSLVSKIYFPRLIVPTASIVVALVDFMISFVILIAMMAWFRFLPSWQIVFLPLYIALAFLATLGPSLWFAALNVRYRDFRYIIPFVVQFGMYITPV